MGDDEGLSFGSRAGRRGAGLGFLLIAVMVLISLPCMG